MTKEQKIADAESILEASYQALAAAMENHALAVVLLDRSMRGDSDDE